MKLPTLPMTRLAFLESYEEFSNLLWIKWSKCRVAVKPEYNTFPVLIPCSLVPSLIPFLRLQKEQGRHFLQAIKLRKLVSNLRTLKLKTSRFCKAPTPKPLSRKEETHTQRPSDVSTNRQADWRRNTSHTFSRALTPSNHFYQLLLSMSPLSSKITFSGSLIIFSRTPFSSGENSSNINHHKQKNSSTLSSTLGPQAIIIWIKNVISVKEHLLTRKAAVSSAKKRPALGV